jgi:hypothetical protein
LCGLAFGAYLVLAYSLYRILVLYCLFNIVLLWVIERRAFARESSWFIKLGDSEKMPIGLAISLMVALFVLIIDSYERLYARSSFMPPLVAVTLVIVAILGLASTGTHHESFFTSSRFLLPVMISISLFVNFSIYLVQPNAFARPLFATVDSYRDFANAARIVKLSGYRPEDMVLEQYYAQLPVVPMLISILSIVGTLSIQESLIILAVILEILGVVGVWLLSTAVVHRIAPAFASSAGVLSVTLVWLQPYFIDPAFYTGPLRLSIPFLVLVGYLLYQTMVSFGHLSRSLLLSILILGAVIVPMHATSALAVLGFWALAGLLAPADRRLGVTVFLIALVSFCVYLLSGAALPYITLLSFSGATYSILARILSHGAVIISNAAESARPVKVSELYYYMDALPLSLLLSICTVCVGKSWRLLRSNLQTRNLNSLHLAFGVLAFAGFAGGYISELFGLDMRYLAFPVTPLLVVSCAVVLSFALRNVNTSRMRGLVLIGVITVYAFSMAGSPNFLYEANPTRPRLIPTASESVAGDFVSANMQFGQRFAPQILSDWPFYNYVEGVAYSSNIGIDRKINVVDLMFSSPTLYRETYVILRQYYLQNVYLQNESPNTGVLKDVDVWNSPEYNKIYDSSTAWVYLGAFEG